MQRLRETDGLSLHRRAIRGHMARCRTVDAPLHKQLVTEAAAVYGELKARARATEDAEDAVVDAEAGADFAEIAFENTVRDLDADLQRLDRDHPGLGAQRAVFPEGFGAVIDPEGDAQLTVLPALHVRLEAFKAQPGMSATVAKLDAAEAAFKKALDAAEQADAALDAAFAAEQAARRAVREQIESAHGRLRDFYKARPAQAEQFFLRLGSGRRKAKKGPEGGGSPPGSGTP
jgi:hypothetical protein